MERLCPPEGFCQLFQRRKHDQSQGQNIILSTGFQRNLPVIPWHSSPGSYFQHEFKPSVQGSHILSHFFFQTKKTQELSAMTLPLSYGPREVCHPHCYPAGVLSCQLATPDIAGGDEQLEMFFWKYSRSLINFSMPPDPPRCEKLCFKIPSQDRATPAATPSLKWWALG